jgi:peptidoglycan/LPS O-acetylase OafA/YrhL
MTSKIEFINGLRGIAIIAVLSHHMFSVSPGMYGVNLFFILSGFVLYLPYASGKRRLETWSDARAFYVRRASRLLPLYYFGLIIGFLFLVRKFDADSLVNFCMAGFFVNVFSPATFFPESNWVFWSLSIEVIYSALFPLLVLAIKRSSMKSFVILAICAGILIRLVGWSCYANEPVRLYVIVNSILARLDDFALGMLAAYLFAKNHESVVEDSVGAIRPHLGSVLLLLATTHTFWLSDIVQRLPFQEQIIITYAALTNTFFNVGSYLIISHLLLTERGWPTTGLEAKPLQIMGMMCYSFYCWHQMVLRVMFPNVNGIPAENSVEWALYYLFLTSLISLLSYRFIEFPREKAGNLFLLSAANTQRIRPVPASEETRSAESAAAPRSISGQS